MHYPSCPSNYSGLSELKRRQRFAGLGNRQRNKQPGLRGAQRRGDWIDWKTLHFENGQGTTTEVHSYSFLDEKPFQSTNYYRLKQVDLDGRVVYSNIVSVTFEQNEISISPNPTDGALTLAFPAKTPQYGTVQILNSSGRLLQSEALQSGEPSHPFSVSSLPAGMYFVRVTDGGVPIWVEKVVKR